jgi:undecaprenyl-phosphate galactose phosphotransferase
MADLKGIGSDPELQYWFDLRSKVKPGVTGPWQVSGRSGLGMAEMVRLDIDYIQNWSIWLDLSLLAKTLPAVLRRRGAH